MNLHQSGWWLITPGWHLNDIFFSLNIPLVIVCYSLFSRPLISQYYCGRDLTTHFANGDTDTNESQTNLSIKVELCQINRPEDIKRVLQPSLEAHNLEIESLTCKRVKEDLKKHDGKQTWIVSPRVQRWSFWTMSHQ
jgi:hypothetical protein